MSNAGNLPAVSWWKTPLRWWALRFGQRQGRMLLVLSILIGALTGLAVVAFIVLTERLGMRLYPVGSAAWRRMLIPVAGSLGMGYLLFRYFPDARGSGVPQTKAALYARDGIITQCFNGVLRAPQDLPRPPFEITFETPQKAPLHLQVEAFSAALQTMLVEYRNLMAIGANI